MLAYNRLQNAVYATNITRSSFSCSKYVKYHTIVDLLRDIKIPKTKNLQVLNRRRAISLTPEQHHGPVDYLVPIELLDARHRSFAYAFPPNGIILHLRPNRRVFRLQGLDCKMKRS